MNHLRKSRFSGHASKLVSLASTILTLFPGRDCSPLTSGLELNSKLDRLCGSVLLKLAPTPLGAWVVAAAAGAGAAYGAGKYVSSFLLTPGAEFWLAVLDKVSTLPGTVPVFSGWIPTESWLG